MNPEFLLGLILCAVCAGGIYICKAFQVTKTVKLFWYSSFACQCFALYINCTDIIPIRIALSVGAIVSFFISLYGCIRMYKEIFQHKSDRHN